MNPNLRRMLRSLLLCLLDCAFQGAAFALAMLLYTYFNKLPAGFLDIFIHSLPYQIASCALSFWLFRIYRDIWGHFSILDIARLCVATGIASFLTYLSLRYVASFWVSPIIGVTGFYLFLTFTVGFRILPSLVSSVRRYYSWSTWGNDLRKPLLIVGAGEAADMLIKDMQNQGLDCEYRIVGMVDDDPGKLNHTLRGVAVLGAVDSIPLLVKRFEITHIMLAIPSATTQERRHIIHACSATNCRVLMMRGISSTTEAEVASFHNLNVGDLLGRSEVKLDSSVVDTYIAGKSVLITGGGGSIGSELARQIVQFGPSRLVLYDMYENGVHDLAQELCVHRPDMQDRIFIRIGSVRDARRLREVFSETRPDVVFHASAYKHVPLMEECPRLALENNVLGTYQTALCAIEHGVGRFVMLSTDKAVNPTNVMGASKRLAELVIQSLNGKGTEFVAVRFGNVLGSNGSVVPTFRRQIEAGGPVTLMHPDIIRYFMTIPEAVRLVLQAGARARGGETFILDMGEPVKIADLAASMIRMAGLEPGRDIQIEITGLRPGEKLYEELLLGKEGEEKTEDEKIYVARSQPLSDAKREELLEAVRDMIASEGDIRPKLEALLPSYRRTERAPKEEK